MNQNHVEMLNEILRVKNLKFMINTFEFYRIERESKVRKIFEGTRNYIESLDESLINDRNSMLKEVLKYFKANQPKLSKRNYDDMIATVVEKCNPKINRLASKLVNAQGDHCDYVAELQIGAIRILRRYEDGFIKDCSEELEHPKTFKDLVNTALRGVHNRYADLAKEFSKKIDCSIYSPKFDSEMSNKLMYEAQEDDGCSELPRIESSEDTVITNELYLRLIEHLRREENGDEIVAFLQESVNPSDKTMAEYDAWVSDSANRNPFKNRLKMPSKVICKSIGIEYNKVNRFKEIIGITLIKLGVNYGEVFPKYKSMNRNFWLSRGCPAPEIEYNNDGSAKIAA